MFRGQLTKLAYKFVGNVAFSGSEVLYIAGQEDISVSLFFDPNIDVLHVILEEKAKFSCRVYEFRFFSLRL